MNLSHSTIASLDPHLHPRHAPRWIMRLLIACSLLLSGCASTISNDVTAFHDWPTNLPDKSFVFVPVAEQEGGLEYRSYAQLIREQLQRWGFIEIQKPGTSTDKDSSTKSAAALNVSFSYGMHMSTVVVTQPTYDPFWYGYNYYGWRGVHPWGPMGAPPFADPWYGPLQQTSFPVMHRQLHLWITRADNAQRLYEVSVISEGRKATLPMAMPYMVRSAFSEFPGPSGITRHLELKLDK